MNNNANNFQGLDSNQFSKMLNFKTELKYKYLMIILMTLIPFLVFLLVLGNDSGFSDGLIWGISMGMFFGNTLIIFLLTRFTNVVKNDMYPAIFSHTWFWIAWYGLYMIGWWRILVSLIFYVVFYVIGIILAIVLTLYQQKKKFDGMMRNLSGENPEVYEEILKQQKNTQSPFMNSGGMNEDILKNLDEELRKQGIDIDGLDEQFGTFLNKDEVPKSKTVSPDDLKDFTSEEEIIEAIYNNDNDVEEIIVNKEIIDETDELEESKKIIDQ